MEITAAGAFAVHALRRVDLGAATSGFAGAIRRLDGGGATTTELADLALGDGATGLARWYKLLRMLAGAQGVEYSVGTSGRTMLRSLPSTSLHAPEDFDPPPKRSVLSRFAHIRRDGECTVIDSPLTACRVELVDAKAVAAVAELFGRPQRIEGAGPAGIMGAGVDGWHLGLLALLCNAGLLLDVDDDGRTAEDRASCARYWSFADLVFHGRYRTSRADLPVGDTCPLGLEAPPVPPVKPPMSQRRIQLTEPDVDKSETSSTSFISIHESRSTVRSHGSDPMTAKQFGEFLFHTARVRPHSAYNESDLPYTMAFRPYPSGGGCYPLEIYPLVGRCAGLEAGLYHYDPEGHALECLEDPDDYAARILEELEPFMSDNRAPQILIVVTARFGRTAWKYEGAAYALILQEVGALYQSMYLVATAMGLAPCARGGGEAAPFSLAIGTDPLEECMVGSFMIGSRPDEGSPVHSAPIG